MSRIPALCWLLFLPAPLLAWCGAGDAAFAPFSVDLAGHLWTCWHATQESLTTTRLLAWPQGQDLLPVIGGWLDVVLAAPLVPVVGPIRSFNAVIALYLFLAGVGGYALARALRLDRGPALLAGFLLQLDGFLLHHALGGRSEQAALGLVALVFAAVLSMLCAPRWWRAVLCGLLAALLVLASWEMALVTALGAGGVWAAFLPRGERRSAALRATGLAAAVFLLAAGPWIALFLWRTAGIRTWDEGGFSRSLAIRSSITALGWLRPGQARPAWSALLALVTLPVIVPARHRRRMAALGGLLLISYLLALGPCPRLWQPAEPTADPWGPFALLQRLPVLGWFHWPDRLLLGFDVAAPVAAACWIHRIRRWRPGRGRIPAAVLALLVLASAAWEVHRADRWPRARFRMLSLVPVQALGRDPVEGAVLNLPRHTDRAVHAYDMLLQVDHGRPLRFGMHQRHLLGEADPLSDHALSRWAEDLGRGVLSEAPVLDRERLAPWREAGFAFVTLSRKGMRRRAWQRARRVLEQALGPPVYFVETNWICWSLTEER